MVEGGLINKKRYLLSGLIKHFLASVQKKKILYVSDLKRSLCDLFDSRSAYLAFFLLKILAKFLL